MSDTLAWVNNVFDGPPPEGYTDWLSWMTYCSQMQIIQDVRIMRKQRTVVVDEAEVVHMEQKTR
jgi:hypothetical protein